LQIRWTTSDQAISVFIVEGELDVGIVLPNSIRQRRYHMKIKTKIHAGLAKTVSPGGGDRGCG